MSRRVVAALTAVAFIGTIVAANYVTTHYGIVSVGFGFTATAGTYLAGLSFVLRDAVQDVAGRWAVLAVIAVGAVLSYLVAAPFIALASVAAFAVSELVDFAVYTPLRERGYIRAAVASNIVGSAVDTIVFLAVAGFAIREAFAGQMIGKLAITVLVVLLVTAVRLCVTLRTRQAS